MELSPGTHLIYMLAASEASFLKSVQLEPEHFLLGLFKINNLIRRDFPLPEEVDENKRQVIIREAALLSELWKAHEIDPKQFRRRLRFLISQDQKETGPFSGHRSPEAKELFGRAEALAGDRGEVELTPCILLAACLRSDSAMIQMLFDEYEINIESLAADAEEHEKEPSKPTGKTIDKEKKQEEEPPVEEKGPPLFREHKLAKYGRDLTSLARQGKLGPIIGRREEIKNIGRILTQRSRNNPLLLGDPGVGKTAVVEGLALYAVSEDAVDSLRKLHIVEITMSAIVAGTKYRGEFESKIQEVINIARAEENLVLFIDELHTLLGAGAGEGALDASNILKPALGRGDISCIGASTTAEFRKFIEPDGALTRRFQVVWIDEPAFSETVAILKGLKPKLEEHHAIRIDNKLLDQVVSLTSRFITDGYQPDKAIMVLDEACARRKLLTIGTLAPGMQTSTLELEDIGEVVARRTQVPLEVILTKDEDRLLKIEEEISKSIIGQDHAISALAKAVRISRAGLKPPNRPVVLLFAGPTGTGKTELAKVLSRFMFFDDKRLIRLDMSEYSESHATAKILGSPPGYVGFAEESHFIREIRLHPYSVVLLDEIEKADLGIMQTFLQVFDEGRLTDARGRTINCSEAIFILTTNLGTGVKVKPALGFMLTDDEAAREQADAVKQYQQAIVAHLSPELVNRIQEIVVFKPLSKEALSHILNLYLAATNKRLAEREIKVELDETAKRLISREGYSQQFGARFLKRVYDRWITEPLSEQILSRKLSAGGKAIFTCKDKKMILKIQGKDGKKAVSYTVKGDIPPGESLTE
jgi:ATP-dependent Clp protease ATP-binding subunit ClpC